MARMRPFQLLPFYMECGGLTPLWIVSDKLQFVVDSQKTSAIDHSRQAEAYRTTIQSAVTAGALQITFAPRV